MEVALVFPIFISILLMSLEAARLNTLRNTIENAVYEGARRGIVPGAAATDVQATASSIMQAVGAKNIVITTTPSTITDATDNVTVTIDVPLSANSWIGRITSQHMIARVRCRGNARSRVSRFDEFHVREHAPSLAALNGQYTVAQGRDRRERTLGDDRDVL